MTVDFLKSLSRSQALNLLRTPLAELWSGSILNSVIDISLSYTLAKFPVLFVSLPRKTDEMKNSKRTLNFKDEQLERGRGAR